MFRNSEKATSIPLWMVPKPMHNEGNHIISLGALCRWLGEQAESLGVDIFPGFPASEVLYHPNGDIKGVATGEMEKIRMENPRHPMNRAWNSMPGLRFFPKDAGVISEAVD